MLAVAVVVLGLVQKELAELAVVEMAQTEVEARLLLLERLTEVAVVEAVVMAPPHLSQVRLVALVLSSFLTLAHSNTQVAQSHLLVATPSTPSQRLVC
jgi:hypothetical protein